MASPTLLLGLGSPGDSLSDPVPQVQDIQTTLNKNTLVAPGLAGNFGTVPLQITELKKIYAHIWVKLKGPGKPRKKCDRLTRAPRESSRLCKRRLYKVHQRLDEIGPNVLLEELLAGSGGLGPVSLDSIHKEFDPIRTDPSPAVRRVGVREGSLRGDAPLFVECEVAWALKSLQVNTATGPHGLTVRDLRKVPTDVVVRF